MSKPANPINNTALKMGLIPKGHFPTATGIIATMNEEFRPLRALMPTVFEDKSKFDTFVQCSGVGKVNAATAAMRMLSWQCKRIFIVGLCGAIDPELQPGDIVISSDTIQHDMDVTALGFKPGAIPFAECSLFRPEEHHIFLACEAAKQLGLRHKVGRILTGDRFVANADDAARLRQTFGGIAIDMETAAVAQACDHGWKRRFPWLSLRVVSDKADSAAPQDFNASIRRSMQPLVELLKAFAELDRITDDPTPVIC